MKQLTVAIDGPSGSGKSTIAKALAAQLSFVYVDTGAIYRTVGYFCSKNGVSVGDIAAVAPLLGQISIDIRYEDGAQQMFLNGENVSQDIRTNDMSMMASFVSAIPAVRDFLLDTQRDFAKKHPVIMDGRDIGTVVFPNAHVKIFLTASSEIRAKRRYAELLEKGQPETYDEILATIEKRDYDDSHRAIAPLKQAQDAILIDSTALTLEESIAAIGEIIKRKVEAYFE